MKKHLLFLMCTALTILFAACGSSPEPETEKAAELRALYDFYDKSFEKIVSEMDVTPQQADEIFLVSMCVV